MGMEGRLPVPTVFRWDAVTTAIDAIRSESKKRFVDWGNCRMLFSSNVFLFLFLPIVLGLYFLLPVSARNLFLLAASLFFYAWGLPWLMIVMVASIAANYFL